MYLKLREFWSFAEKEGGPVYWRTKHHDRHRFDVPYVWVTYWPISKKWEVSMDKDLHYDPNNWEKIKEDFISLGHFPKEEIEEMFSPFMIGEVWSYSQVLDEVYEGLTKKEP